MNKSISCCGSLLAAVVIGLTSPAGLAASETAAIPPAGEILRTVRPEHPRLLAGPDTWERVRQTIEESPESREIYDILQQRGEKLLETPPPVHRDTRTILTAFARPLMHRVYTLALLANVENDERFADRAWKEMEAAANFPNWRSGVHFLDTAEMTHGFAIGYDWLYDFWDDSQRAFLRKAIIEHGLRPGLCAYGAEEDCQVDRRWITNTYNWNLVCNGGLAIGALAVATEEPEIAGKILQHALENTQLGMASFAPDGGWAEGPGYWRYAIAYNTVLLAALNRAAGTDFGLSELPGVSQTGYFGLYTTGPFGATFNFGDLDEKVRSAPVMRWMARHYRQPALAYYQEQVFNPEFAEMLSHREVNPHALDLVWAGSSVSPAEAGLPLDRHFRNVEAAVFRSAWDDPEAIFVGFKAGNNQFGHSLLDLGSFVLDAGGYRWALHMGGESYSRPGYWDRGEDGGRWHYYRARAEGHNVLAIGPDSKPDQNPFGDTRIVRFESTNDRAFAVADLTSAYERTAQRVFRGIAFDRRCVLIQDEITARKPESVWWFMHTRAEIEIAADGRSATLSQGDKRLHSHLLSPEGAAFIAMDAGPLPSTPRPETQNPNRGIRKLAIEIPDVTEARLAVLLVPETTPADSAEDEAALPKVVPLDRWKLPEGTR